MCSPHDLSPHPPAHARRLMTLLLIALLTFLAVRTAATGLHLLRTERRQARPRPIPLEQEGDDDPAMGGSPRQKRCLEGAPGGSKGLEAGAPSQQQQQQGPSGKACASPAGSALGWRISTTPACSAGELDKDVDEGEAQQLKQLQEQPQQELCSSGSWLAASSSSRLLLDGILDPGSPDRRSAPQCRRGGGAGAAPAEQSTPVPALEVDKAAPSTATTAPQVHPADPSCCCVRSRQ